MQAAPRTPRTLPRPLQPFHDIVELIEAAVLDVDRTAVIAVIDGDSKAKGIRRTLLHGDRVGFLFRGRALVRALAVIADKSLHLPHVQPALDDLPCKLFRLWITDQRPRMASGNLSRANGGLDELRELQKSQHVGDVAAALADHFGDLVLMIFELVDEGLVAARLFEWIEIFALNVLY